MGRRIVWPQVTVLVGLAVQAQAPPVTADCFYVDVYVTHENTQSTYPVGSNPCRLPTPWPTVVTANPNFTHQGGKPDGTPNGFYLDVRVPLP